MKDGISFQAEQIACKKYIRQLDELKAKCRELAEKAEGIICYQCRRHYDKEDCKECDGFALLEKMKKAGEE